MKHKHTVGAREIRMAVGVIVLLLSTFFFIDFSGILPQKLHGFFHFQFIPALLSAKWIIVIVLLLSVLFFGRIYCSVICPFGLLQDAINRLSGIFYRKKRKPIIYKKPHNAIRYGVLALTVLLALCGFTVILTILDPYSNFGRIATTLFKPVYAAANNLAATVLSHFDNYSLYQVSLPFDTFLIIISATILVILFYMAIRYGRLWCNTLCPVGTFFGLISRYSVFGVKIPQDMCTGCGVCLQHCKADCINVKEKSIDHDRCVMCFNCISHCPQNGLSWGKRNDKKTNGKKKPESKTDKSRRRFLTGATTAVTLSPIVGIATESLKNNTEKPWLSRKLPLPPGATDSFADRCTGCQLCVTRCPMHTLRPSFLERGITGIMQPHMHFEPNVYCNYDCTICSEVCPTGALQRITKEEKHLRQVGVVKFCVENCVVKIDNIDCGACAEHCPTGAVTMVPYQNNLTIPHIDAEVCIGCGGCESICPQRPRAIFIEGREPQLTAKAIVKSEQKEVEVTDFGF